MGRREESGNAPCARKGMQDGPGRKVHRMRPGQGKVLRNGPSGGKSRNGAGDQSLDCLRGSQFKPHREHLLLALERAISRICLTK